MKIRSEETVSPLSTMLKVLVFTLPTIVVAEVAHSRNHFAIASSWVAGALLQALIPPARQGLLPILGSTILVGAVYVVWR
jgi:hypothetical protein